MGSVPAEPGGSREGIKANMFPTGPVPGGCDRGGGRPGQCNRRQGRIIHLFNYLPVNMCLFDVRPMKLLSLVSEGQILNFGGNNNVYDKNYLHCSDCSSCSIRN